MSTVVEPAETTPGARGDDVEPPSTSYRNPLVERYASAEMSGIFSDAFRFGTWRRLWLALAEAQAELGVAIPAAALEAMRAHLDDIDVRRAAELERRLRHDVMAHVHQFGEVAPAARPFIHLGATSAYVTDNTELLQHRLALQLVRARMVTCIAALAAFARQHRAVATLGYTHFQTAQPTTVGKRATLWIQDLLLDLEDIDHRLATLRFRGARGTTGTEASFLEIFGGDGAKVDEMNRRIAEKLGFGRLYAVTGQTYPRKADYAYLAALAGAAASASKFAHDLRLLQHLKEVEEPFEAEQIGSSAMPYKRNPMRTERMTSLARHVITLSIDPAFTAATQWFERTLDDSANRRIAIAEAYLGIDAILILYHNVAQGLVVHPGVIRRRITDELPFLAAETILVRAVRLGGDRQDLHERFRQHAMAAAARTRDAGERNDLIDRIAADTSFGLSRQELDTLLDPALHVGRAPEQVDAFLRDHVQALLDSTDSHVSTPELRA